MHRRRLTGILVLAATAGVVAMDACTSSSSNPTGTNNTAPPQAVQTQVASSIASSIAAQIQAFTTTGIDPFLVFANRLSTKTPFLDLSRLKPGTHAKPLSGSCPTETPADPVDTDEDGIPDTVTETYTAANCSESSGGTSFVISGTIAIGDPTPSTPDLAYNAGLNNFEIQESSSADAVSVTFNGSVGISETLSSITEAANYSFSASVTPTDSAARNYSFAENLTAMYSFPATASLLVEGNALPAGTLNVTGTETATYNGTSYMFSVSTPTPLSVDPSCATSVTAGVLTVTFSGASTPATVTWTACGVYTVSYA